MPKKTTNKICKNCHIEYSINPLIKYREDFCTHTCVKASRAKWLRNLKNGKDEFLREMVEKNLHSQNKLVYNVYNNY